MRRLILTSILVSVFGVAAFAQAPVITDVLDGAGYTATIAQGSIFVVKGTNLATKADCPSSCPPYPTTLGGATVTFTPVAGGTAIQAAIFATIPTQINAVLPATTAAGDYNVTVTSGTGTSAAFKVTVVVRKFGLITVPGSGAGRAVVEEITSTGQYQINRYTTGQLTWLGTTYTYAPAIPGEFMVAYGTGLNGATAANVTVLVGNTQITPTFAGPQGQYPGFDQINFQLPTSIQTGCNVPFQVLIAGQLSNSSTISIAPASAQSACVSNGVSQQILTALDQGGTIVTGEFLLTSQNTTATVAGTSFSARSESASGGFGQITADNLGDTAAFTAAPGSCQVFHRIGAAQALLFPDVTFVDAGTITLVGPNISTPMAFKEDSKNFYTLNLGTSLTLPPGITLPPGFNSTPVITAGTYTLSGAGGTGVKSFTASTKVDSPLTLTSPTSLPTTVPRSSDLKLAWSGGDSDMVQVMGASGGPRADSTVANPTYNSVVFICTTTADKGSITIPSSVLSQLPATPAAGPGAANGIGFLQVTQTGVPSVTNGLFITSTASGQTVPGTFLGTIGFSANTTYQ
jgi:uncharacterized protein (TIGR03437 family)